MIKTGDRQYLIFFDENGKQKLRLPGGALMNYDGRFGEIREQEKAIPVEEGN
jgi:hypothetical protein